MYPGQEQQAGRKRCPLTSPLAGKQAPRFLLVDVPRLVTAHHSGVPEPAVAPQRVSVGIPGHRPSGTEDICKIYAARFISNVP